MIQTEKTRTKQILKEHRHQESIISKTFHCLSLSQKQTQETYIHQDEIGISINLSLIKGTYKKDYGV